MIGLIRQLIAAVRQAREEERGAALRRQIAEPNGNGLACIVCVIDEMGSNNDQVRKEARAMVAALGSEPRGVLEPAALASLLIDSAKATRNSRTRCECLLQVAELVRGMQCLASPVKLVNGLAAFIQQEGDLASKGAALEALAAAHALLGQRIWKMLAALDNRSRQVIAQRIEKAGNVAAQPGGLPDGGRPEGLSSEPREQGKQVDADTRGGSRVEEEVEGCPRAGAVQPKMEDKEKRGGQLQAAGACASNAFETTAAPCRAGPDATSRPSAAASSSLREAPPAVEGMQTAREAGPDNDAVCSMDVDDCAGRRDDVCLMSIVQSLEDNVEGGPLLVAGLARSRPSGQGRVRVCRREG